MTDTRRTDSSTRGLTASVNAAWRPPQLRHILAAAAAATRPLVPFDRLGFALVGALAIIPIILMYTAWSYYVFRGKVRLGEEFHS